MSDTAKHTINNPRMTDKSNHKITHVWAHETNLTPSHFIEVPVPS
jgi:hypothetical protein